MAYNTIERIITCVVFIMKKLTDQQKIEIVEKYLNGKSSPLLGVEYNVHQSSIISILKIRNIKRRRSYCTKEIPENFINPDIYTSYFYGFFWGDGYIHNKGAIRIIINNKDADEIDKVLINVNKFSKNSHGNPKNNLVRFDHCSMNLRSFMINLDFKLKSYNSPTKVLNIINETQHYLFWRGLFDADGCWYHNKKNSQSSFHLVSTFDYDWSEYINLLTKINVKRYQYVKSSHKTGKYSYIKISNKYDLTILYNYIYQDNNYIGLKRKLEKAKECLASKIRIDKQSVKDLFNSGESISSIANKYNYSYSYIYSILKN